MKWRAGKEGWQTVSKINQKIQINEVRNKKGDIKKGSYEI